MGKLKVAILEDNKALLKDLKMDLEETNLVEVVVYASNSDDFLKKVSETRTEAIIVDIDLVGDSMTGIDIAHKLNLPVLFVSGKTKDFYQNIEELNMNTAIPVEHLTKPISLDKLKKILPKFISEINSLDKNQFAYLDFGGSRRNKIAIDTIVYLCADKANGSESNNKRIFFTNRSPEILIDFSFTKMEDKGLSKNIFIQIHRSFRVNAMKINCYSNNHEVEVEVYESPGKTETVKLAVAENFRKDVSKLKK